MFVFNFGVESLEQSVKLGLLVILDFLGNSFLYSPLFPSRQPKRGAVAKENLPPAIVSLADFQRV